MRKTDKKHEDFCQAASGKHEMQWSKKAEYQTRRRETWMIPVSGAFPFYPYCMEEEVRLRDYWFMENFTRFWLAIIALEGDILFHFGNKDIRLSAGEILFIPKNTGYSFENGESESSHKVVLEVIGQNLNSDLETLGLNRLISVRSDRCEVLADQIRAIGDLIHLQQPSAVPELLGRTYRILVEFSDLLPEKKRTNNLLLRAQMLLESNFETRLTLPQLARKLNSREEKINRLFKEKLGITPMRYRIEKKMERARHLLVVTSLTIKEISFQLGYCDPFYFSSEFRRITGFSPSQVRNCKDLL